MDPDRDYADLTDEELEALENAQPGHQPEIQDNGQGEDEGEGLEQVGGQDGAPASASEATGAVAAETAQDAQATDASADKVAGVASKDGSRVLPYAALQAERRTAKRNAARAEEAENRAKELAQQLEDLKAGKAPPEPQASDEITEAEVIEMEQDFPEHGQRLRKLFKIQEDAKAKGGNTQDESAATDEPIDPAELVQEAVDQVPLLVEWQLGDAEKFARAQQIDAVLQGSPKWANKPLHERFAKAASMVAEEYDIDVGATQAEPSSKTPQAAAHKRVIEAAARQEPNTLSDFKGGTAPQTPAASFERMSPPAQVDRWLSMTDDEINAALAKSGG
jgi:hypothetical protein